MVGTPFNRPEAPMPENQRPTWARADLTDFQRAAGISAELSKSLDAFSEAMIESLTEALEAVKLDEDKALRVVGEFLQRLTTKAKANQKSPLEAMGRLMEMQDAVRRGEEGKKTVVNYRAEPRYSGVGLEEDPLVKPFYRGTAPGDYQGAGPAPPKKKGVKVDAGHPRFSADEEMKFSPS